MQLNGDDVMNDITELESPMLASETEDDNQFNDQAKQLKSLVQGILDAPELDTVKVNRIKQSIVNGDYQIDAANISKKIIESIEE